MTVGILSPALLELGEATSFFESRRSGLGDDFADEFDRSIKTILEAPTRWPGSAKNTRGYRMDKFQYIIFYGVQIEEVVVVAVSHPSRQPLYWVDRI